MMATNDEANECVTGAWPTAIEAVTVGDPVSPLAPDREPAYEHTPPSVQHRRAQESGEVFADGPAGRL